MDIPAYKPSGRGGHFDLKNIKIAEMLGWGGYKGQFKEKYTSVAGMQWINNRLVYNDIELKDRINPGTKQYDLLEFLGFSVDDINRLRDQIDDGNNRITSAKLRFALSQDYDEQDMDMMLVLLMKYIRSVDYIDISPRRDSYGRSMFDLGLGYGTKYPEKDTISGIDLKYKPYTFDIIRGGGPWDTNIKKVNVKLKPAGITRAFNFKAIKNGHDITRTIPRPIRELIVLLSITERHMVDIEYKGYYHNHMFVIKHGNGVIESNNENGIRVDIRTRITRLRYDRFDKEVIMKHYEQFIKRKQEYIDETTNIGALLWRVRDYSIHFKLEELTQGMFYAPPPLYEWDPDKKRRVNGIFQKQVYLKVDGWNGINPDMYGYLMSAFMDIKYETRKQGFFKRFIGGLIKFITKLVGAVLKLFMKIPGLRQIIKLVIKVIAAIMGVNINVAQDMLIQVLAGFLMMAIGSLLMPGSTSLIGGGITTGASSGLSSLITYSSQAMSMYNSMMQGMKIGYAREASKEQIEENKRRAKAMDANHKSNEAFFGTMGTLDNHMSQDNMMYNLMFNPFDIHQQAVKPGLLNESILPF